MKKLFMFLCVVMMFFSIAGCPSNDPGTTLSKSSISSKSVTSGTSSETKDNNISPVPEPATLILIGTGLFGLAAFGRNKFKK
ncbi:MAG: PEP-CTERM sorting domain-containing protein [Desulfobacterales bacterium]